MVGLSWSDWLTDLLTNCLSVIIVIDLVQFRIKGILLLFRLFFCGTWWLTLIRSMQRSIGLVWYTYLLRSCSWCDIKECIICKLYVFTETIWAVKIEKQNSHHNDLVWVSFFHHIVYSSEAFVMEAKSSVFTSYLYV